MKHFAIFVLLKKREGEVAYFPDRYKKRSHKINKLKICCDEKSNY